MSNYPDNFTRLPCEEEGLYTEEEVGAAIDNLQILRRLKSDIRNLIEKAVEASDFETSYRSDVLNVTYDLEWLNTVISDDLDEFFSKTIKDCKEKIG